MPAAATVTTGAVSITVEAQAYGKVVLHAAKYPASTVRGLLVGSSSSSNSSAGGGSVTITDAIPLVHNWTDLTPVTEIGCALAQAHLSSTAGSSGPHIVGLYEAPALMGVREPSRAGVKLARKIASLSAGASAPTSSSSGAVVLVVNNSLLLSPSSGHALLPFFLPASASAAGTVTASSSTSSSSSGGAQAEPKLLPSSSTVLVDEAGTIEAIRAAIEGGQAEQFVDFDDHLADTRKDWLSNAVSLAT
ncbi:hypothetical protein V8E36_000546 [Tilletia maclaganii]